VGPYSVTEDVTPLGGGAPPHIHHGENEMFYVLEGEYEFRCDDRLFKATKDSLVALTIVGDTIRRFRDFHY